MKKRNLFLFLLISSLMLTACGGDKKDEANKTLEDPEVEEISLTEDELEEADDGENEEMKQEGDSYGLFTEEEVYELAKKRLDLIHIEPSENLDSMRYMGEYLYAVNIGYSRKDGDYFEDVYIGADSLDVYDRSMLLISNLTKKNLNE